MKNKIQVNSLKPYMDVEGLDAQSEVERKRFSSKITLSADEDRTCVAVISCPSEDADGDIIIPTGADLKRFQKNPVVMYSHNYSGKPIAKVVALSVSEEGITAKMKFAETEEANDVWSLIKGGFINANSIGFLIKGCHRKGTESFNQFIKANKMKVSETCQRIISEFELLENSICAIPCNPEALMVALSNKSIALTEKTITELDLPKVVVVEKVVEPIIVPEVKEEVKTIIEEVKVVAPEVVKEVIPEPIPIIIPEPKRYIKIIRHGGVDLDKQILLKKLAMKGRIV